MKKIAALLLASLMALALFGAGGCDKDAENAADEQTPASAVSSDSTVSVDEQDPGEPDDEGKGEAEPGDEEETLGVDTTDSITYATPTESVLLDAFEAIDAYQPGTAGAGYKCFAAAIAVLDTCEGMDNEGAEAVKETADRWLTGRGADFLEGFELKLEEVDVCARDICSGETDIKATAEDAGAAPKHDSYSLESYEYFFGALSAALAEAQ